MLTSLIAVAVMDVAAHSEAQRQRPPLRVPSPPPVIMTMPPPTPPAPRVFLPTPPVPPVRSPPPPPATPQLPPRLTAGTITSDDYPAAALRAEAEGTTSVRLNVGANGRVEGCTVMASAGNAALDSATCSLITRRFRFRPATRDGQPVASTVTQRVTWRIPEGPEIRFAQGRFTWTVTVSPAGSTECRIEQIGEAFDSFDIGQCEDPQGARMVAPVDLAPGQPPVRLTHVLSLIPDGERSTLPRLTGAPTAEWTVVVEANAEGRITSCTPVARQGEIPGYASPGLGRGCESLQGHRLFVPDPRMPVRRARLGSSLFVEVLSAPGR